MITEQDVSVKWNALDGEEEKMLFLVGGPGSGKSQIIRALAERDGWKTVEAKELIDESFLETPPEERQAAALSVIAEGLARCNADVVMVDSVSVLFTPVLHFDPVAVFREVSKKQPILIGWRGSFDGNVLFLEHRNDPKYASYEGVDEKHVIVL